MNYNANSANGDPKEKFSPEVSFTQSAFPLSRRISRRKIRLNGALKKFRGFLGLPTTGNATIVVCAATSQNNPVRSTKLSSFIAINPRNVIFPTRTPRRLIAPAFSKSYPSVATTSEQIEGNYRKNETRQTG